MCRPAPLRAALAVALITGSKQAMYTRKQNIMTSMPFVLRVNELGSGKMHTDEDFTHCNKTEYDD
ncbi:hypothetical protein CCH79_00015420 [Gambusia affinis]|uniref:Uncharacterized protein n=1 Tax=Gambusia affinis TaxID=33528 RepID=A0A315VG86_GAMAF|nr:hypothetical protein CCH79_00015420 [Gambusia affinis]